MKRQQGKNGITGVRNKLFTGETRGHRTSGGAAINRKGLRKGFQKLEGDRGKNWERSSIKENT